MKLWSYPPLYSWTSFPHHQSPIKHQSVKEIHPYAHLALYKIYIIYTHGRTTPSTRLVGTATITLFGCTWKFVQWSSLLDSISWFTPRERFKLMSSGIMYCPCDSDTHARTHARTHTTMVSQTVLNLESGAKLFHWFQPQCSLSGKGRSIHLKSLGFIVYFPLIGICNRHTTRI